MKFFLKGLVVISLSVYSCAIFKENAFMRDKNKLNLNNTFQGKVNSGRERKWLNTQFELKNTKNQSYGNPFYVTIGNSVFLQMLPPAVRIHGTWYRASDHSLRWYKNKTVTGRDKIGIYMKEQQFYHAGNITFITSVTRYKNNQAIVLFGQEFPEGAEMTFTGFPWNSTMSAWPVFVRKQLDIDLGYLAYGGIMSGDTEKQFGQWSDPNSPITYGFYSGPLVLFDYKLSNTFLVSPFDQFMAVSTMFNETESSVSYGIMGNASHIPPGFKMETMIYYGTKGINQIFQDWGKLMREVYERSDKYVRSDFSNNYLGYWMDGGAYYSYTSEPSKTMEQTVLDIKAQSLRQNLPYRYIEFDEWFYCQCPLEPVIWCCDMMGTELWESPKSVFPHGFKNLSDKTKWPVHASNKWWSHTTPYAKQNGGNFTFLIDNSRKGALPVDREFWQYLMNMAKQRGQFAYEQDFQRTQFLHLWQLTSNITLGGTWYTQMGEGAALNGLVIQYCMAPSRAILQALEIPSVTQARASKDYRPGYDNWRIGVTSMFLNAVGIRPFKDNFWTTTNQTGYNFGKYYETQLDLVNLVSTMSMGPVGPSDKINCTDRSGLLRCCNEEGLILQPSAPPTAIDTELKNLAFSPSVANEIWSTYSSVSRMFFGIIIAADVKHEANISPENVFKHLTDITKFVNMILYKKDSHRVIIITNDFSSKYSLMVPTECKPTTPCVYYTSPQLHIGSGANITQFYLLGELSKWVPVSSKRIQMIRTEGGEVYITIMGMPLETVEMFYVVGPQIMSHQCTVTESGNVVLLAISKKCIPRH